MTAYFLTLDGLLALRQVPVEDDAQVIYLPMRPKYWTRSEKTERVENMHRTYEYRGQIFNGYKVYEEVHS